MIELDDLWGDEASEKPPQTPPQKKGKQPKPKKVKDTSVGFRIQLGTCRRRGKGGELQEAPILLAKDPLCWVLRIGSSQTYPVNLASVFETIAQETALELNDESTIEDLVEHIKAIEGRIKEMGTILDKRIREFIVKKSHDSGASERKL